LCSLHALNASQLSRCCKMKRKSCFLVHVDHFLVCVRVADCRFAHLHASGHVMTVVACRFDKKRRFAQIACYSGQLPYSDLLHTAFSLVCLLLDASKSFLHLDI
jgi:hypothetical protein